MDREQRITNIFQSYREVNKVFYHLMLNVAQEHGITPIQLMTLRILKEQPQAGLSFLAAKLNLNNSTTCGIIDRMVKADLVTRERSGTDRRAVNLSLTDRGKALWNETEATRMKMFLPLLQLSVEEENEFHRIQQKILSILRDAREEV
ncbi:MarR family winged helix-turn-helix transcriptional regulator [Gorillibacterium massiliense]|uniref:MarR family winged helix-turn-helix transcriptional regulator n=1 Tax=Gorillibacterium massiliense TaxID=1280390 RepID=UPI0004B5E40E|nr:MarR family transcriptional regulator [Gorillibacterium massiliense]